MLEYDIFSKNLVYPNASKIFDYVSNPISKISKDCIFVLDTNALLLPYYTSSHDLKEIRSIFESLIERQRLLIPGQVAREFASNKSDRIKEVFQKLSQRMNVIQEFQISNHPLLDGIEEYAGLKNIEKEFNDLAIAIRTRHKRQLDSVLTKIKEWAWNDPVSELYRQLLTKEVIHDFAIDDKEKLKKELELRYVHRIPPGYKDKGKIDDGIGDLLIWFTILDIAKKLNRNIVFVSGEEKSDWVLKSEGQILYPRFELIMEFSTVVPEKSFHIVKMSEFIKLTKGTATLIEEIKQIELDFRRNRHRLEEEILFRNSETNATAEHILYFENSILYDIDLELDSIKNTILRFVSARNVTLVGDESFLADLTTIYRNGFFSYEIYKRLMHLYGTYFRKESLPLEVHFQNIEEIRKLKIVIFEALANTHE